MNDTHQELNNNRHNNRTHIRHNNRHTPRVVRETRETVEEFQTDGERPEDKP